MSDLHTTPWSHDEFTDRLRDVGRQHYHDRHPFHRLMNDGGLDRDQLRVWVANRFYYQKIIPIKDAIVLSRCPVRDIRRRWIQRITDHDGRLLEDGTVETGGIEKWLRLGEALGFTRDELESERLLLPAVRYSVDAYLDFVRTRPWVIAVASSLTELFAPKLMAARLEAFERHYTFIDSEALAYFRSRLTQAPRDSDHALAIVLERCTAPSDQQAAVDAIRFKCDLLWAQLDAIHYHCTNPTREAPA